MTTPGLEEENKTKPDITKKIGEMADEVHPDSIVKGNYFIPSVHQNLDVKPVLP